MQVLLRSLGNTKFKVISKITPEEKRAEMCRNADVIISAVGVSGVVKPEYLTKNQLLIDVGLMRDKVNKTFFGDCRGADYQLAGTYTTSPGGIGHLTMASL